jgi:two-component system, NarL family, response regulator NreC
MNRVRIAVADDHAVVREGLRTLLGAQPGFEVVGEAGTAEETLACVRSTAPDVLTLDLAMPGWGGGVIEPVLLSSPQTRIVVYSMHDDPVYVRTALAAGVRRRCCCTRSARRGARSPLIPCWRSRSRR